MLTVFINVVLMLVAFALGYALQPKISRKLSYRKRGQAAKKRAYVKKAAKVEKGASGAEKSVGNKLNGSAGLSVQAKQLQTRASDTGYANGGNDNYSR